MLHFPKLEKQKGSESEQLSYFPALNHTVKELSLNLWAHYPHGFLTHHSNHVQKKKKLIKAISFEFYVKIKHN